MDSIDSIGNKEKRPEGWSFTSLVAEKNLQDGVCRLFPIMSNIGLTQNSGLVRYSSLICANPFKIREDLRRLADEEEILRKSCNNQNCLPSIHAFPMQNPFDGNQIAWEEIWIVSLPCRHLPLINDPFRNC